MESEKPEGLVRLSLSKFRFSIPFHSLAGSSGCSCGVEPAGGRQAYPPARRSASLHVARLTRILPSSRCVFLLMHFSFCIFACLERQRCGAVEKANPLRPVCLDLPRPWLRLTGKFLD